MEKSRDVAADKQKTQIFQNKVQVSTDEWTMMIFFAKNNLIIFDFNLVNGLFTRCRLKYLAVIVLIPKLLLVTGQIFVCKFTSGHRGAVIKEMFSCKLV